MDDNTPLIIAGGGGGAGKIGHGQQPASDAIIEESDSTTGAAGNGGSASGNYAGAGAGLTTNGASNSATAAMSFVNGGVGGKPTNHARLAVGGFGGGGGAQLLPGGGGGYAGGNKTGTWAGSGQAWGGSSYNSGTNQSNVAGIGTDHGYVIIKYDPDPEAQTEWYVPLLVDDVLGELEVDDKDSAIFEYSLVSGAGDTNNSNFKIVGSTISINEPVQGTSVYNARIGITDGVNQVEVPVTFNFEYLDTDGDGTGDSVDIDPENPDINGEKPDFSSLVDATVGDEYGLSTIESQLVVWLDASNINGTNNEGLYSGDSIGSWADLSGNGVHVSQDTSVSKPTIDTTGLNNKSVITFDGSDDYLSGKRMLDVGADSYTMIVVFRTNNPLTKDQVILEQMNKGGANTGTRASMSITQGYQWGFIGESADLKTNMLQGDGMQWSIGIITYDGSEVKTYTNGYSLVESKELSLNLANGFTTIGAQTSDYSDAFDGQIAEILVFNDVLADSKAHRVLSYLAKKWELESVIDSDGDEFSDQSEINNETDILDPSDNIYLNALPDFSDIVDEAAGFITQAPALEPNLVLWLDASNIDVQNNNTMSEGDRVSRWFDLSGKANNAMQGMPDKMPIYFVKKWNRENPF